MNKLIAFICLFVSISATSVAQKKIVGNGELKTENRKTESYNKIKVTGSANVEIVKGNLGNLTVTAESNIIDYLETFVKKNSLVIRLKPNHNFKTNKDITVVVPAQKLSEVSLNGSGKITTKNTTIEESKINVNVNGSGTMALNVVANKLIANVNGSGNLNLNGNAESLDAVVNGSGDIDTNKIKLEEAKLNVNGSGNIKAQVTTKLKAIIIGSGKIFVTGNPKNAGKEVIGSGTVTVQ